MIKPKNYLLLFGMKIYREMREVKKKPSTSELIDWIRALQLGGIPTEKICSELPFVGTIVKKDDDLNAVVHGRGL